jgi:hypothetical protein
MVTMQINTLRSFGQRVEFEATRSVELLKAIDDTIYACAVFKDTINAIAKEAHTLIVSLKHVDGPIDKDGSSLKNLETARDALGAAYGRFAAMRESAGQDSRLSADDGVVEAFDSLLDCVADAHNIINELCWAVGEHDADLDTPLEGEFESADDLFKAMGI